MATDVHKFKLRDRTGDGAWATEDVSGSAVSAVVLQEADGEITITMTT